MTLWDQLSQTARDSGALAGLEDLLNDQGITFTETEEAGPPPRKHITATWQPSAGKPLSFDPGTGAFKLSAADSTTGTPIEFPDPTVSLDLRIDLDSPGGDPTGPFIARLTLPSAVLRAPFLSGARINSQTRMLEPDPDHPVVKFVLPRLVIETSYQDEGSGLDTKLVSASTAPPGATDPADLYDFVRMEPGHAFIGPGAVVGFGFRTAALDLSGTSNPPGAALAMPSDWQGLWLPEVRLFVAPTGMEGLAVSAGVDNLWIGIGEHSGVTGTFTARVVDQASAPILRIRFQDTAGRWYGVPETATSASLPETTTVYADAGGGIAPMTYAITVDGTTTASDRAVVTVPAAGSVDVTARVTDGRGRAVSRTLTCSRRATTPTAPSAGGQPALAATTSTTGSRIRVVAETADDVTLALEPEGGDVTWTWSGGNDSGPTATVPLTGGGAVTVTAARSRPPGTPVTFDCYWLKNHPLPAEDGVGDELTFAYSLNRANSRRRPALEDGSGFQPDNEPFREATTQALLDQLPAGNTFALHGYASYDGIDTDAAQESNLELSRRRMRGLKKIIETMVPGATFSSEQAHGSVGSAHHRNINWHATAIATSGATETITAVVTRPAAVPDPPTDLDEQPEGAPVPACFHSIGVLVEIVRNTFVRAELDGEFDVQTAAEDRLAANGLDPLPPRTNPQDGVCRFLVRLRVDEARGRWDALAEFRAVDADTDGLAKVTRPPNGSRGLNALGAVAALAPLLATATPASPDEGELVGLAVATGGVAAVGAANVIQVQSLTLRGGELRFVDGPDGTSVALLLDVETTLSIDLVIVRVRADKPLTARYQAVGVRSSWDTPTGGVDYVPVWMFDPSRGYSLDVPTGALVAKPPLGDLLQVLGFKVSRDNPVYVEAQVGIGADLGIVSVDAIGVRVRVDQLETPQLTAFGATVDVPGVLHGSGYLELPASGGVTGAIDLTLQPLAVRVAATVKVERVHDVTGVFVGVEVEFPVPIVLGNSGLGIFGVLGGVGVNFERAEDANLPAPALTWLEQQLARQFGVLDPAGWRAAPGRFAFAGGILLGTLEGGYLVHLKGVVILELPGPRLLFVTRADVLQPPPGLRDDQQATFLAVLDIDFARGTIMIGLVAAYRIPVLLEIRVPATALFPTQDLPGWFVDLGTWQQPATVRVFELFEGVGYVMVHGRPFSPLPPALAGAGGGGLTIAAGLHVQFVWGSTSLGLYLKVAGGFDAIVSFQPFSFTGVIEISGELRLFIVSIGASAKLTVTSGQRLDELGQVVEEATYIKGEVCGHVDFFFFSVEGCVELELGDDDVPDPQPEPLVKGVVLIGRSPALVEGTATDRLVDGKLGDARDLADPDAVAPEPVPIDAIPAILFDVAADASGLTVLGSAPLNNTALGANPWVRRGRRWWAYRIESVELSGALHDPNGQKPSVWWTHGLDADAHHGPALALLSWLPTATPKAVTYGEQLTTTVTEQWGTVCDPAAPPAPVLWTFDDQPAGPSADGWTLSGTPWPDDPGTHRSAPVRADLRVTERWRCGDPVADTLRGIDPGRVIRDAVRCPGPRVPPETASDPLGWWGQDQQDAPSREAALTGEAGLRALLDVLATGTSLPDARAAAVSGGWDPEVDGRGTTCRGAVLQSPYDDGPEPIRRGAADDEPTVRDAWAERRFEPGELLDAVRFTEPDGLLRFRLLLLLDERGANTGELVVRCLDADGQTLVEQPVDSDWIVRSTHPLPPEWVDVSRPWAAEVERSGRLAAVLRQVTEARLLSLVEVDVTAETVTVEVGWLPDRFDRGEVPPPFHVVAADGLLASEAARADWDSTRVQQRRDALETALTQDPDDHALLEPGTSYTLSVTWKAASKESETQPTAPPAAADYTTGGTQRYAFSAEGNDRVPDRLEPWLVATSPGPDEAGTFCDEPVRIAFSTQAVSKLFAAYGTELRAYVHAASGDHPKPPGQALAQPFPIAAVPMTPAAALQVYAPWETAVREVADGLPCIPAVGERTDVHVVTLAYRYEPVTEYLLDVERVPLGAAADARGARVLRVPFATSRFRSVAELAELFLAAPVEHRVVSDRAPLDALVDHPAGPQLDAAFVAAGLGMPDVPRYPRVVVLWDAAAPAQPVAVVVEGNEELWRSRPMPVKVTAPVDSPDPSHQWWAARESFWLLPETSTTAPSAGQPASATARLVRGPGDTRLVAMLGAGSRGTQLRLDLRHRTDELSGGSDTVAAAVRVDLVRPPWEPTPEEED